MKNFIFISPNFPTNYWQFCRELKNNGMNVLGIGDQPYDELKPELKDSLNEYYKVGSLENYDEVYRAVAFFAFKYGRIDWLESNNEYWLERDAALRTDFHITSGFQTEDMPRIKYKSKMKEYYQKAGIATARYHMVDDLAGCKKFVEEVGYPVVVKPDNGVGASDTHKLASDAELEAFLAYKAKEHPDVEYIMEEFVRAEVNSYDAIIDGSGNPIFEAGNVSPMSIMDIVNNDDNSIYYIIKDLPEDTRAAGRAAVKPFAASAAQVWPAAATARASSTATSRSCRSIRTICAWWTASPMPCPVPWATRCMWPTSPPVRAWSSSTPTCWRSPMPPTHRCRPT